MKFILIIVISVLCNVIAFAQKRVGMLTPSKDFILNDKMVKNFMLKNKISRDSLANIILKNNSYQSATETFVIVNLNSQEKQMTQYSKLKLIKVKRKIKKQDPLKNNFWTKYIRKKSKTFSVKSAKVTDDYKGKCFELCSKNYCDYLVVVNCFRANNKGKWNLSFRNQTMLELHYDIFNKAGEKVYYAKTVESVNIKEEMEPKVFLRYIDNLSKANKEDISNYLKTLR